MRFLKGVVQTESGRTAEAIATFVNLTESYPELPEPYNNLAVLYAAQSQFDKARAALEMAIRTNPSYATAHENLGDVYAKLASQAYSKALQLDATNTAVQPKLALIRELFLPAGKAANKAASVAASGPAPLPSAAPAVAANPPVALASTLAPAPAKATASVTAVQAPAAVPVPVPTPAPAPIAASLAKEVEAAVHAWAAAWSAKDLNGYLNAYGKDFNPPGQQSRKAWEDERRGRIVGKSRISVKVTDLNVTVTGNKAIARFKQAYSADGLNVSSRKTLEMNRAGERWVIVRESSGT
jgi:ketosteroid isomerase-like protein